jgi:hypothetical protein
MLPDRTATPDPDDAPAALPVKTKISPVIPPSEAPGRRSAVDNVNDPDDGLDAMSAAAPDTIRTEPPPKSPTPRPPDSKTNPPAVDDDGPTTSDTDPAVPDDDAPVDRTTWPDAPDDAAPLANKIDPELALSADTNDTAPLTEPAAPDDIRIEPPAEAAPPAPATTRTFPPTPVATPTDNRIGAPAPTLEPVRNDSAPALPADASPDRTTTAPVAAASAAETTLTDPEPAPFVPPAPDDSKIEPPT